MYTHIKHKEMPQRDEKPHVTIWISHTTILREKNSYFSLRLITGDLQLLGSINFKN